MAFTIRSAATDDAALIAGIYNQGIADRGATFETEPRTAADIEARLSDPDSFATLVAQLDAVVVGWAG